jgi:hypothetical protein
LEAAAESNCWQHPRTPPGAALTHAYRLRLIPAENCCPLDLDIATSPLGYGAKTEGNGQA